MTKNVAAQITNDRLVPVYFNGDPLIALSVLRQCYDAGLRSFEFTNRGENALEVFAFLKSEVISNMPEMILGIGTIWTPEDASLFISAGADFVVAPGLNPLVGRVCAEKNIPWYPGCMTPTEVFQAKMAGATLVKIFPGSITGPTFIASLKAVLPDMKFMVTGGVSADKAALKAWFDAGVTAVGMGKELLSQDVAETFQYIKSL